NGNVLEWPNRRGESLPQYLAASSTCWPPAAEGENAYIESLCQTHPQRGRRFLGILNDPDVENHLNEAISSRVVKMREDRLTAGTRRCTYVFDAVFLSCRRSAQKFSEHSSR
uniref:TEA domain-containing protein n=1 Tax=Macrostomum lignano TaxID=282301 RepID=A0A1I8F858_9PLAT